MNVLSQLSVWKLSEDAKNCLLNGSDKLKRDFSNLKLVRA